MSDRAEKATAGEAAAYIEQVTGELRELARRSSLPFLVYLIDMANKEAALTSGKSDPLDFRPPPRTRAGER